jgi:four helix bundle protein
MKYSSFEELPVWNAAIAFALKVFETTQRADLSGLGDTRRQLERAALSISNNIAEGFERGTTAELINFLYIARGSAGECRSMLRLCERLDRFSNFRSEISNLIGAAVNVSKQLHGWIEALKNSDIKGVKFLTEKEKSLVRANKEQVEFDLEMESFRIRHQEWLVRRQVDPDAKL